MNIREVEPEGPILLEVSRDELALISSSVMWATAFISDREYHALVGFEKSEAKAFTDELYELKVKHGLQERFMFDQWGNPIDPS